MKFTLSWLKRFLDTDATVTEIATTLTNIGLEIESVIDKRQELVDFTVAHIIDTMPHPAADKLRICTVQTTTENLQIVCGAPNARAGIKVVLAKVGVEIPNGKFKIKASEIRGIKSMGMLCSAAELLIGSDADGIIELPDSANIGEKFIKYYGLDDPVIQVNVTPNRGDALGVYGIARDLAAVGIGRLLPLELPKIDHSFHSEFNVKVMASDACPLFCIREFKNVNNIESPSWLKQLLENIGVRPISAIVDITNYMAYSFGQPMHAYDADKLAALEVKLLKDEQQFQALNNKEYKCISEDLVICDGCEVHALAGIIGGNTSACSENTRNIILEAAVFEPLMITKTGRRLQIDTDSRYRFERRVDKTFVASALDIATQMILSICGGTVSEMLGIAEQSSSQTEAHNGFIDFPLSFLQQYSGLVLSAEQICTILKELGFKVVVVGEILKIQVPAWRHDVKIKEDIVEEILRIYGYDQITEIALPNSEIIGVIPVAQKRLHDLRRIIACAGYDEVITWSFMSSITARLFAELHNELVLVNPISVDLDYMRPSIVPNLLAIIAKNQARRVADMSLFEIGPVFCGTKPEDEITMISGVRCGDYLPKNCHGASRIVDIFDIKADLAAILSHLELSIDRCQISTAKHTYYHPTRSASLSLGKNIIGHFGQIHPTILQHFDIEGEVIAFELNITNIPTSKPKFGRRTEFITSDFQINYRDYAFIIDVVQPVGNIISYIKNIDNKLIKSVELFDVYTSDKIASGKKSVAISVQIQADDHTLTEEELLKLHNAIIDGVKKNFAGEIRKL
ncbi:Phenylalanine--tRNA ligase beta subunit [Candidatus Trichorickettsia mobilis]|uniref:Phenylalanine--tRNA ligase beta subunit n=1 Tax=Candidatus Trichorickettsia mobilis TaxID=1346319 RepID=A0ABZ0USL7_9RICK|nr:phenylalanine--tRNA ligase subunit beta [Candidatus Trichorickettsia mobilis]WPY01025.1 Phenylalanine--tRNA ligase beta subunit [Candidatus Trichorickettsia mobilis]